MTRQRRCTYRWTTNGGWKRIYIFMFLERAVCIISFLFFFCNNIGFLLLARYMVNTAAWKVGREKVWAKVFLPLFLLTLYFVFFSNCCSSLSKKFLFLFGLSLPSPFILFVFFFFFFFFSSNCIFGVSIFNVIIATNWEIICNYRVLIFVQLYVGISFFQTVVKF